MPEVNLGPPTVSTPATLTPVGYLQFKNGALSAEHSSEFSRRFGISQVTKLSVFPRHEVSECPRDGTRDPGSRRRAPRPEIAPYTERITGKSKVIKTNENGLSVEVRDFPVAQYFRTCLRVKAQHPALQVGLLLVVGLGWSLLHWPALAELRKSREPVAGEDAPSSFEPEVSRRWKAI